MKKLIFVFISFIVFLFTFVNDVSACKCAVQDAAERFEKAGKVFLGEVISVKAVGIGQTAKLEIINSWSGLHNN